MWLHQVSLHNDAGLIVKVLSENNEPYNIRRLHKQYNFRWIRLKSRKKSGVKILDHHNVRFKMWNLTSWKEPYILLDVDAIPFCSLSKLVAAASEKPWIAVNHQNIPGHTENKGTFLNGGVQIVAQPDKFRYEDFTQNYGQLKCPGAEQALIYTYFKKIDYDYTHPDIGFVWNACAGYSRLSKHNNKWRCFSSRLCVTNPAYQSYSISEGTEICINHYWDEFKPWKIGCPMYDTFLELVKKEETSVDRFVRFISNETY